MIYIGADKQGFRAIQHIEEYLISHHIDYQNVGVKNDDEDAKLEEMIPPAAKLILAHEGNKGIFSCGTGIGIEVGINKFSGIRACLAVNPKIATWSVVYDKCNVLCLVGWESSKEQIFAILDAWFSASYDGDQDRLIMFEKFNEWH